MRDIYQSDPHLLSDLMGLDAQTWQPEELGAIFRHQLQTSLAVDLGVTGPPNTFGELLQDPRPPLELLIRTKDFGKQHRNDPASPLPHDIATVLYFAGIVAALTRCDQRITQLDDDSLRAGIEWVMALPWLDEPTRALFNEGRNRAGKP